MGLEAAIDGSIGTSVLDLLVLWLGLWPSDRGSDGLVACAILAALLGV